MAADQLRMQTFIERARPRLKQLYGKSQAAILLNEIVSLLEDHSAQGSRVSTERWSEQDVILICYGDSVQQQGSSPLRALGDFARKYLAQAVSAVHVLPFFPYSSDDGFSVIDYRMVNPELGDWDDIQRLGQDFDLMMDLVINHVSRESLWFIDFINNRPPACYYFIEMDPEVDLSEVVRPRKSAVLTPVHTHRGLKHVWSTFSEDQIDVNFANPAVLLEYVKVLLLYLGMGARLVRLDAVAFLWKKLGTSCINLPQTHQVVKLLRDLFDAVAPEAILLTETNLPHNENLSYFGNSDEAHMVYQFSLAPLLLHALHKGTGVHLTEWASSRCEAPKGCTYLNFTASHDGIGLRPVEGILPEAEIAELVESMHSFGGFVSMRSRPDGSESPYEINIALFDAFKGTDRGPDRWQVARLMCSQTVMMALKGIPAVYIHSLTATANDLAGVERSGRLRSINRRKWDRDELDGLLADPETAQKRVFDELRRLLVIRRGQSAFHPVAEQQVLSLGDAFFGLWRRSLDGRQQILAVSNLTDNPQSLPLALSELQKASKWVDLISGEELALGTGELTLAPYQSVWLTPR